MSSEYIDARGLEELTGTKASTWRYWDVIGQGPPSFKLGKRRLWRLSVVQEWLAKLEREGREARGGAGGIGPAVPD